MLRSQLYPLIFGISVTIILIGCQQKSTDKNRQSTKGNQVITLIVRCKAKPPTEDWRGNNLIAAAEVVNAELQAAEDKRSVRIQLIQDDKDWGAYKTEFELASDANQASDIILSGHEHIGDWASANLILPITDKIPNHPEFSDVIPSLWQATEWNSERWGIPQDAEVRLLYYSKPILRKLGWSDEKIENLPTQITKGEFTWLDMLQVAKQAVNQKIVVPGNGWWHRSQNGPDFLYYYLAHGGEIINQDGILVFDRQAVLKVYQLLYSAAHEIRVLSPNLIGMDANEWNTTISTANRVLFWFAGSWNWADWATNYLQDFGVEAFLFKNVGFAPIPAGSTGKPITLTHPLVYMISTQSTHPDLALRVIAKATTRESNTNHAVSSAHLGILKSQKNFPPYVKARFLSEVMYLLNFTTFLPNSTHWGSWSDAFFLGIQAVESGDLKPAQALEVIEGQIKNDLGNQIIIR